MNLRGRFSEMVRQIYVAVRAPGSRPPIPRRHPPPQKTDFAPTGTVRTGMKGKEVWITADGRLRVNNWFSGWRVVPSPAMVSLNEYYPMKLDALGWSYSVADLGLDYRDVSRVLGISRLDNKRAAEIWESPNSVRGEALAVDFAARELVLSSVVDVKRNSPGLVYPFGSIKAVRLCPEPKLVQKAPRFAGHELSIRSFPMSMQELAAQLGVPVEGCPE